MASKLKRTFLRPIPYILTDKMGHFITRLLSRNLIKELSGELTDKFMELLLGGMDLSFCLSKGYRKNIKNFKGKYLFETADGMVEASATFDKSDMKVHTNAIENWDVKVTFKNAAALRAYLFSENQDILDSILKNEVEVEGNLNYIYRFGFLARDLVHRLRLEI